MSDQELSAKLKKYRLSVDELGRIKGLLGRDPVGIEWALFSALWSEHCSYKSSKIHLRKFAQKSAKVLQAMGENAGVFDLGQDEKIAFKMESHNHPSFIEPYQGAATGVGGILRDIFTMGARPIAIGDYLCFGEAGAERMETLVEGVVSGISGYGNCVGVPTVTGQTEFHSSYNNNILVNAFALGLFQKDDPIVVSHAKGVGNYVVYVGAKTGRDGVHGASMASESFAADSASKRPTVQIGDPFYEKLLIESCIEVMKQDLVVAIQDMGAAGLTSSCFEMAAKGKVGFRIKLDKVPLRDSSVGAEEILLSESQERMLLICEPAKFARVRETFEHWGLDAAILGEVTTGPEVELLWKGDVICKIDPALLVENAPVYERPFHPWKARNLKSSLSEKKFDLPAILESAPGTARNWIYEQYDQRVGTKTVFDCSESVAVLRLPKGRGLGIVLGCRPQLMRLDARLGGYDAAFYPALELAAKGFQALAMTDCLNFGNPEKIEIMSEFVASVDALADAAKLLDAPVISGNVSFYNETLGQNITSTPATGLVGIRHTVLDMVSSKFKNEGDQILLWRMPGVTYQGDNEFVGDLNPAKTAEWIKAVFDLADAGVVVSSRVSGKFGLGYTLFRMTSEDLGANIQLGDWAEGSINPFGCERLYEVVLAGGPELVTKAEKFARETGTQVFKLGTVVKGDLVLGQEKHNLKNIHQLYNGGWRKNFGRLA